MNLPVIPGSFPPGYCWPVTPQDFLLDLAPRLIVQFPDNYPLIYVGASAPPADQQDRIWFNLTNLKWYHYQNGNWWRAADTTPGPNGERIIWYDTPAALWSYQGGDGTDPSTNTPTLYTGAMWQEDTDFSARFPLARGTLPSGLVISVGDDGGEEKHALTSDENGPHTHPPPAGATEFWTHANPLGSGVYNVGSGSDTKAQALTGSSGLGTAHNTMPPYTGVIFAKRSIRAYVT